MISLYLHLTPKHAYMLFPSYLQSVVEHTQMSSDMFTQYLHHNYIDFFDAMDDVVRYAPHTLIINVSRDDLAMLHRATMSLIIIKVTGRLLTFPLYLHVHVHVGFLYMCIYV